MIQLKQAWEKFKQNKKISIPTGIIAVGILLFFILIISKPSNQINQPEDKGWPVTAMTLESGTFTPYINLYGKIESPEMSDLESVVEADVNKVLVREGDTVDKDQLLVELDDSRLKLVEAQREATVTELKSELEIEKRKNAMDHQALDHEKYLLDMAKKQVDRQEQLKKTNAISALSLDQSHEELKRRALSVTIREESVAQHKNRYTRLEAKLKSAEADLNNAKMDVADAKIYAPFAGKITKVNISPGERVQVGEVMLQMFNKDDVEIRAQIPEPYIEKAREVVAHGQKRTATIYVGSNKYLVYLDRISGEVGEGSAGIDGLFKVISNGGGLSMGRIIQMKFLLTPEDDVFAVPETAIFDSNRIYKIIDGHLQAAQIERVGNADLPKGETGVLIKGQSIKAGDEIIINPLPNAITGLKVNVIKNIGLGSQEISESE